MADVNAILEKSPRNTYALRERGLTWIRKHQPDRALADFSELIRLDPKDTQAHYSAASSITTRASMPRRSLTSTRSSGWPREARAVQTRTRCGRGSDRT